MALLANIDLCASALNISRFLFAEKLSILRSSLRKDAK
jgi:hypothetical protein